jgi:hypothetical protein
MRTRRTAGEIARSLGKEGLRFRTFSVESEGDWSSEDADWNYKDVPHLNHVHSQASTVPAAIGDEFIATINMQKIAGISMPIALANYVASDGSQVYFTTLLCFVLVVETQIGANETSDKGRTRVETTYHIGGPPIAMLAFPLLRRILTANYKVLMSEDLPMREQRGTLRRAGFKFKSDGRPRTFDETVDLTVTNVVPPPLDQSKEVTVDLALLAVEGSTFTVGEGPQGLRFVRGSGQEMMIFQRHCDHEGACLDAAAVAGSCLICPWHAKRVKPLAIVMLDAAEPQRLQIGHDYGIFVEKERCTITGIS